MKILTQNIFESIVHDSLFEHTKEWYLSEEEANSLKDKFIAALEEKIIHEELNDQTVTIVFGAV